MRKIALGPVIASLFLATGAALAQTAPKPAFEVASVKPADMDMQKMAAAMMAGGAIKMGPHIDGAQAEYTAMALRELIAMAYNVKPFQISGPDWITSTRFDIKAKMPGGSTKDDAPLMLQTLLEERFKLAVRRETKEHSVLALVVGKGGSKMKETEPGKPLDESAPLKPGESSMSTIEGPMRMTIDAKGMGSTVDMGTKGRYTTRVDPSTMTAHMQATQITMPGFVNMLNQFSQMGGGGARTIIDMTDLKGTYEVAIDFSLADLMAMARAQGMDVPGGATGATGGAGANAAATPGGGTSITDAVQALGLRLESRKAQLEQLIVEHAEKTPTEN